MVFSKYFFLALIHFSNGSTWVPMSFYIRPKNIQNSNTGLTIVFNGNPLPSLGSLNFKQDLPNPWQIKPKQCCHTLVKSGDSDSYEFLHCYNGASLGLSNRTEFKKKQPVSACYKEHKDLESNIVEAHHATVSSLSGC